MSICRKCSGRLYHHTPRDKVNCGEWSDYDLMRFHETPRDRKIRREGKE